MDVLTYYESTGCFALWIGAVAYSIYQVIKTSSIFDYIDDPYGDFQPGWLLPSKRKDVADFEWETTLKVFFQVLPWLGIHAVVSELLRWCSYYKILPHWQIVISLLCLLYNVGFIATFLIIIQPLIFQCVLRNFQFSRKIVWLCGIFCLCFICVLKSLDLNEEPLKSLEINETQHYMLVMAACWINLRCLSCFLDNPKNVYLIDIFSYFLYLPNLFFGPIILYSKFEMSRKLNRTNVKLVPFNTRLIGLLCSVIRFGFWFVFTEFALHFIYVNAFSYHPELVQNLDYWTLCGYGYCMGQFFHLKYVVMYGISCSLSTFDHVISPKIPKCIGRIHLYSDMWKYFDNGLYQFLVKYIYKPNINKNTIFKKLVASFLCFAFVYVWHGLQQHILVWVILNFLGIIIEISITKLFTMPCITKLLTIETKMRCFNVLASPLLAMSAVSNFYFFAGMNVGHIFFKRFFSSGFYTNSILLFFLFCCCNVSNKIKEYEKIQHIL